MELLVVVGIIALLMSVLMPALSKAAEQARFIVCRSNLKWYGLAERMYMDDHDGLFTHPGTYLFLSSSSAAAFTVATDPDGPFWPYLKARAAHMCPTFKRTWKSMVNHECFMPGMPVALRDLEPQYSYVHNATLGYDSGPNPNLKETDLCRKPSDIYIFTEENMWLINISCGADIDLSIYALNGTTHVMYNRANDGIATYHTPPKGDTDKGSGNVVFVDGSVDSVTADEQYDNGLYTWAELHAGWPFPPYCN